MDRLTWLHLAETSFPLRRLLFVQGSVLTLVIALSRPAEARLRALRGYVRSRRFVGAHRTTSKKRADRWGASQLRMRSRFFQPTTKLELSNRWTFTSETGTRGRLTLNRSPGVVRHSSRGRLRSMRPWQPSTQGLRVPPTGSMKPC